MERLLDYFAPAQTQSRKVKEKEEKKERKDSLITYLCEIALGGNPLVTIFHLSTFLQGTKSTSYGLLHARLRYTPSISV